jgi:SAM-dependent methyltransferase
MSMVETHCNDDIPVTRIRDTYNHLYGQGYADSGSCYVLADLLLARVGVTPPVLDVGCGHCPFLKVVQERTSLDPRSLFGVDIADAALRENVGRFQLTQACATHLPFADKAFSVCYSADMLEHLPEQHVGLVLREMARVTSRFIALGVCCREALTLDEYGQQVHLTVRPAAWWEKRIAALGRLVVAQVPDDVHGFYVVEVYSNGHTSTV